MNYIFFKILNKFLKKNRDTDAQADNWCSWGMNRVIPWVSINDVTFNLNPITIFFLQIICKCFAIIDVISVRLDRISRFELLLTISALHTWWSSDPVLIDSLKRVRSKRSWRKVTHAPISTGIAKESKEKRKRNQNLNESYWIIW